MMAPDAPDQSPAPPPPPAVLTYSTEPPTAGVTVDRLPDGRVRLRLPTKGYPQGLIDGFGPALLGMG
jgi:hypothetical protein